MNGIFQDLNKIRKTKVGEEELNFSEEKLFLDVSLNLFQGLNLYIKDLALVVPATGKWNTKQAVLGSQVVRLYKLNCAIYEQAMQNRLEICYILSRLIYETVVNLLFLIKNPDLLDAFIAFSLKPELRLRNVIMKNIKSNGNKIMPIEKRMLDSIKFDFEHSGINIDEYKIIWQTNGFIKIPVENRNEHLKIN